MRGGISVVGSIKSIVTILSAGLVMIGVMVRRTTKQEFCGSVCRWLIILIALNNFGFVAERSIAAPC